MYRDQGSSAKGGGKEVCDLLVVGDYQDWNMRAWEYMYHLAHKITGTGLDDKPVEAP